MAIYVAGYVWSASIQDTARDVYYAFAIHDGRFFPLEGPILGDALHLGPVWFYVLAIPLWIRDDWLSIAIFAGLLGSLKFPLAALCGKRLLDSQFGLLWAACLALPGWAAFEQLIFFNANPAAAIVLVAIALWVRVRNGNVTGAGAFGFGLTFALALHVHPTTAPIVILGIDMLRRSARSGQGVLRPLLLMAAGFAVPFVPYVVSQVSLGMPDVAGAGAYVQGKVAAANLLNLPALLWAYSVSGPEALLTYLWGMPSKFAFALAGVAVLPLAGLFLMARPQGEERSAREILLLLGCAVLAFSLWIALLRPTTPWYFVFVLAPFWSGLLALGLWMVGRRRSLHGIALGFPFIAILVMAATTAQLVSMIRSGEGVLSSRVLDIKERPPRHIYSDTWFPAVSRSQLGQFLCGARQGHTLHGQLAYVVDRSVAVDAFFACGSADGVKLMGRNPATTLHSVGMSRQFWSRLGAEPDCWIGSLGIVRPATVAWPDNGIPIPDGRRYFPRDRNSTAKPQAWSLSFETGPNDAVLVSNILLGYESLEEVTVTVDGRKQLPIARNDHSTLYALQSATKDPTVSWSLSFAATQPDLVDVVAFGASGRTARPDCNP